MEPYTTNIELSQLLKNAGAPQDTQYMWVKFKFWDSFKLHLSDIGRDVSLATLSGPRTGDIAAYTAEELLDLMPKFIWVKGDDSPHYLYIDWAMDYPKAYYWHTGGNAQGRRRPWQQPKGLANDLVYLYLWLTNKGYLN